MLTLGTGVTGPLQEQKAFLPLSIHLCTLLKLPSMGTLLHTVLLLVFIGGSIAPLIELGAGFDMDLTARENIYLNGAVLGYDTAFMEAKFQEIMYLRRRSDPSRSAAFPR